MTRTFRFVKTEDNKFIWTDDKNYKFVWENPRFFPYDENMLYSEDNGILHYYYCFMIYQICDNNWKLMDATSVGFYPSLPSLQRDIHDFMRTNITDYAIYNSKKQIYYEMTGGYSELENDEDFYELNRYFRADTFQEWYSIRLGAGLYENSIYIKKISFEDLLELQDCIDSFIRYGCEKYNQETLREYEVNAKKYICKNHKLYIQELDEQDNPTGHDIEVFCIGDRISNIYVLPEDKQVTRCLKYHGILISAENNIIMLDTDKGKKNIPIKNIQYISLYSLDKKNLNISQMAQDFYQTLSELELKDFQEKSIKSLSEIYADMIIRRYSIRFYPEHGLLPYQWLYKHRKENAISAITEIISEIKQNLI